LARDALAPHTAPAVHAVVTWAVIWFVLRFFASARFCTRPGRWRHFQSRLGLDPDRNRSQGKLIWWLKEWQVLPEAWLYGLRSCCSSPARGAFMAREYSISGWITFFLSRFW